MIRTFRNENRYLIPYLLYFCMICSITFMQFTENSRICDLCMTIDKIIDKLCIVRIVPLPHCAGRKPLLSESEPVF